ncbi:hypothetical protein K525DRAFT_169188, partial [Schizophyllum commune Loenen D]
MHDEPHRSTRGSERMIETVYEPAFYRPDVRSITVRASSEIRIFGSNGSLNRLKLSRAVRKAFSRFIDVCFLVDTYPLSATHLLS